MSDAALRDLEREIRAHRPVPPESCLAAWLRAGGHDPRRDPGPGDVLVGHGILRHVVDTARELPRWMVGLYASGTTLSSWQDVRHIARGPHSAAIAADDAAQVARFFLLPRDGGLIWLGTNSRTHPLRAIQATSWRKWAKKSSARVVKVGCVPCTGAGYLYKPFLEGQALYGDRYDSAAGPTRRRLPSKTLEAHRFPSDRIDCDACGGTGWSFSPQTRRDALEARERERALRVPAITSRPAGLTFEITRDDLERDQTPGLMESIQRAMSIQGAHARAGEAVPLRCACVRDVRVAPGRTCGVCGLPGPHGVQDLVADAQGIQAGRAVLVRNGLAGRGVGFVGVARHVVRDTTT